MRSQLTGLTRRKKQALAMAADGALVVLVVWLAFVLRLGAVWPPMLEAYAWLLVAMPLVTLPIFRFMGVYRTVVRQIGTHFLHAVLKSVFLSTLCMALFVFLSNEVFGFSRSVPVIYGMLLIAAIGLLRILLQSWFVVSAGSDSKPVIIYGAGEAGSQLQAALRVSGGYKVVAHVDDDPSMWRTVLGECSVHDPSRIRKLVLRNRCREIFLAIPSSSAGQRREIMARLAPLPVKVRTVPALVEIVEGDADVADLRAISIDDILGRDSVDPDPELLGGCVRGKVVLVSGAGGSIGSELCRQILALAPHRLVLLDRSEFALYDIHQELISHAESCGFKGELVPVLCNAGDDDRVLRVLKGFKVETIYHAAAYKHVPLVEYNVAAGVENNTLVTWRLAEAAERAGVSNFVLISTDKAVRPTNVMGASKRLAELVLQALQARHSTTRFCMVRFGNVLDSSGSVVPLFKRQIEQGGPITVTDPEVVRYFMTIPEAAGLVLQAGSMGDGGDVFLLDMGSEVKIVELARLMIRLAGLTEKLPSRRHGDIEIVFTGLRPGEKLYEELLIGGDVTKTRHPMIMSANEALTEWSELQPALKKLELACANSDAAHIHEILHELVEGFAPTAEMSDLIASSEHSKTSI